MIFEMIKDDLEKGSFPKKLYKFRSFGRRTEEIITTNSLYFSSPTNFNDPFDCNLSYRKEYTKDEIYKTYEEYIKRRPDFGLSVEDLIEQIGLENNNFVKYLEDATNLLIMNTGVLSLSKNYENITMWSHYSDNHKGLVFELEVKEDIEFFNAPGFVEYKKDYDVLSYIGNQEAELIKLFLTKNEDWKYENEFRVIDYEKYGLRKFKKRMVSSIIFGFKSTQSDIKAMIELCEENEFKHVTFKKAKLVHGKFALDFYELKKEDYI